MNKIRFSVDTLGCKVNQSESDFIAGELQKKGLELVSSSEHPDFCLINTCTVTSRSDRKARQLIRRIKSENRNSKILVTGCFVVFNKKFLKDCGVDFIVENKDKNKIPDLIMCAVANEKAEAQTSAQAKGGAEGEAEAEEGKSGGGNFARSSFLLQPYSCMHSRPLVKIQDGCEQNCTYCIVPEVRGRYKSVPYRKVLQKVKELESSGFEEVVLTGIHIGKYGVDFDTGSSNTGSPHGKIRTECLADLLERITEETDIKRIRISSIEVNEIDRALLDILKKNKARFANHLHIPLQSGSDKILKLMRRPYTTEYYYRKVGEITRIFPDIALTTDVMVGFPGEDEKDFTQTVDMIRKIAFSKIHVFKFSKRKHTPAYWMGGQVDEEIKSKRSMILRSIGDELRSSYLKSYIGKTLNVICEELNSDSGITCVTSNESDNSDITSRIASGTSENYIKVYFKIDKSMFVRLKGKIVKVTTNSEYKDGLRGIIE